MRYGGVLARFLAYVLDGLLVAIPASIVGALLGPGLDARTSVVIQAVVLIGLSAIYFIGFWTSASKATLGMRLFNLQVGNAADGAELTLSQAVVRWVALGLPFQALSLLPPPVNVLGGLTALWALVLLVSTIASPSKQGVHDRLARSAMVQPVGREGPVIPCLILFLLVFVILPIVAIVMIGALIGIGGQVSTVIGSPQP